MGTMSAQRVIAYIDGYNFYKGLLDAGLLTSRWLDLHGTCKSLLRPNQELVIVRYFTTRVRRNPEKTKRQAAYIDALLASGGIEIDYGVFTTRGLEFCKQCKEKLCKECKRKSKIPKEKQTDVNIAVRLLDDAYSDRFDVAIVISGDSDLVPAINYILEQFPKKIVLVAPPPKRISNHLAKSASGVLRISNEVITSNHLPNPVITSDGHEKYAPRGWLP